MREAARRERARVRRPSGIAPAQVWALEWIEAQREPDGEGWRLLISFSGPGGHGLPPGLRLEHFSLWTRSGLEAPGWLLSDLDVSAPHATLRLSRQPGAGPWTEHGLVVVYHGALDAEDGPRVDPLRDRHELLFAEPAQPLDEPPLAAPATEQPVGDYAITRAGLLQRLALTAPEWQERSEADPWMALVDLLAWAGDRLCAYQDAVATEAWLLTARRTLSLRRHARLLGYAAHDGCNPRVWLHVVPEGELKLPVGAQLASKPEPEPGESHVHMFHVLERRTLSPELERLELYRWGMQSWSLPAGTRQLALVGHPRLQPGDVLLLPPAHVARVAQLAHERDPLTGVDITRVELFAEDALPAALEVHAGTAVSLNLVLAAQGAPVALTEPELGPGRLRFTLHQRRLGCDAPFDAAAARGAAAARALQPDPERALLDVKVEEHRPGQRVLRWELRRDLLASGPYDRHVVAELDDDVLQLRFGDGVHGRPAPPAALLKVTARHVVARQVRILPGTELHLLGAGAQRARATVVAAGRPIAATSARELRLQAPASTRGYDVCREAADYARHARLVPGVFDAQAELRWTGSWHCARLWILPEASDELSSELQAAVRAQLEQVRMLGVELQVCAPRFVLADVALEVVIDRHQPAASIERALRARLGGSGLFARSAFRLGTPLSSGALIAAASGVPGVREVRLRRFRRSDERDERVRDWITIAGDEVLRAGPAGTQRLQLELSRA